MKNRLTTLREPTDEETSLRDALDQVVLDTLKPLTTALVVIFSAFIVFNLIDLPEVARNIVVASDLILVAIFAGLRFALGRGAIPRRFAHQIAVILPLLVLSNVLTTFFLLGSPVYVTYMCIVMIGAGCVILSPKWLGISLISCAMACLYVISLNSARQEVLHYGFTLFAASGFSTAIHISRLRYYRRLFEELKEREFAEKRYRDLVEGIDAIVWEGDPDSYCFTYVSNQAEKILEYPLERWFEGPDFWPSIIHPDERERIVNDCIASTEQGLDHEMEYRMVAQSGRIVWIHDIVRLIRNERGKVVLIRGLMIDVTAARAAKEDKLRLEEQLRQAQKLESIGTLAGGVAHDFNNLLAGILGYADMLKEAEDTSPKVIRAADMIVTAAERAAQLTRQLLGFARKGKLRNMPVDVNQTIRETAEFLQRTLPKNIDVVLRLQSEEARVQGDPDQLHQVFLNLAINARDAMPEGGELIFQTRLVELDDIYCRAHADIAPGHYIMASVTDTGEGIPGEIRGRLFEPFFTTKDQGRGTGMGLAMVYGIVKNHAGAIEVYSEEGVGSSFKIYIPAFVESGCDAPGAASEPAALNPGTGRILVVDDEPVVREMAAEMLQRLGYEVHTAEDGQAAVDYYREHAAAIDLAIIDMVMPRLGGRDCFREMKKINPALKAFLSTGFSNDGAVQEILEEGMLGCTLKPYRMRDLAEAVSGALAAKSSAN